MRQADVISYLTYQTNCGNAKAGAALELILKLKAQLKQARQTRRP